MKKVQTFNLNDGELQKARFTNARVYIKGKFGEDDDECTWENLILFPEQGEAILVKDALSALNSRKREINAYEHMGGGVYDLTSSYHIGRKNGRIVRVGCQTGINEDVLKSILLNKKSETPKVKAPLPSRINVNNGNLSNAYVVKIGGDSALYFLRMDECVKLKDIKEAINNPNKIYLQTYYRSGVRKAERRIHRRGNNITEIGCQTVFSSALKILKDYLK